MAASTHTPAIRAPESTASAGDEIAAGTVAVLAFCAELARRKGVAAHYAARVHSYHAHPAASDESAPFDPTEDHRRDKPRGSWEASS